MNTVFRTHQDSHGLAEVAVLFILIVPVLLPCSSCPATLLNCHMATIRSQCSKGGLQDFPSPTVHTV